MSPLTIPDLGDELQARLHEDAARHGRSYDEHVRHLLLQAVDGEPVAEPAEAEPPAAEIEYIELVVDQAPSREQGLREHSRVEYGDIRARFSSDGSTRWFGLFVRRFPCEVVDISVRGARIRSGKALREQEAITLFFRHASGEKFSIASRVVRVSRIDTTCFEYGVQFRDVMPQGNLRSLICRKVIDQKLGH